MSAAMLTLLCLTVGPADLPPDVYTMRDRHLQIPIRVNDARRGDLVELTLYVSTDQGRTWRGAGKAKPAEEAFNFHADKDGMYWFSVQAVDRDGKYDPPDIAQVQPALKVMIDTQKTLVQFLAAERVGDEVIVSWQTTDSQADVNTLKLEYRLADGSTTLWQLAPLTPALAGQTRFRPGSTAPLTVRLQIADRAGVPSTVMKEIAAGPAPINTVSSSITDTPMVPAPSAITNPPTGVVPEPQMPTDPPKPVPLANVAPVPPPSAPIAPPPSPPVMSPPAAAPIPTSVSANDGPSSLAPLAGLRPGEEPAKKATSTPPDFASMQGQPAQPPASDISYVKDRAVGLEFEIDRKGPSGVKKIETYITQDDGQTWFRYGETTETKSPLQVALPEKEGTYGFHIVAYSGVMQSEGPPKNGRAPDVRLHVDRTSPLVEWYPPAPDASMPNALTLRFSVHDTNLMPNSVTLEWSRQANGGWQSISASGMRAANVPGVPHLKECTWLLPADLPDAVFLRITARDLAGNVGERITRDPVTVDLQKPTARVKRVITSTTTSQFRP
jgi:hypothetical protein